LTAAVNTLSSSFFVPWLTINQINHLFLFLYFDIM
jgi:hypothetical protein